MPSIHDYEGKLEKSLIDAASLPDLRKFMEPSDIEQKVIDYDGGLQARVDSLNALSVRKFIERIISEARQKGVDLKEWICGKKQFNLCEKLDSPLGDVMRRLDEFIKNKISQGGKEIIALAAAFSTKLASLEPLLVLFGAIGFFNNVFINLCDCEVNGKNREKEKKIF
ncbi:hypothetical protein HZU72_08610 [Halomonas sp. QX-2]|uniref:Uncharacterized protein n=1 Tax=Vreelandella sedimenti TaxID=2729618 RepID=A0A7Z0SM69_9GAMM|nr:hypothetical protein [Halomonas sedimenti]NYT72485.1 hypothetical protein [Halomonas sedimenti]